MTLYNRKNLPDSHKIQSHRLRKAKNKMEALPSWLSDPKTTERILSVWTMYLKHDDLLTIAGAHINPKTRKPISITQVYKDINRAKQINRIIFENDLYDILMSQIETRRAIIREARTSIANMHAGIINSDPEGDLPDGIAELIGTESSLIEWTPTHARAEADLLRVIMENEKQIEQLLGLYDKKRDPAIPEDDTPEALSEEAPSTILVVDTTNGKVKMTTNARTAPTLPPAG